MTPPPRKVKVDLADRYAAAPHGEGVVGELRASEPIGSIPPTGANGKQAPPALPWKAPADRALSLGAFGPRLSTAIATLDTAMRGGLRLGRLVVLAGQPGAGKTMLALMWARSWVIAGYYVAILAADEDADGILIRWGQLEGLDRDLLESGDEEGDPDRRLRAVEERAELSRRVAAIGDRLLLVDADDGDGDRAITVEQTAVELKRRRAADPTAKGSVLIADSLQTAEAADSAAAEGPRLRVDALLKALRRAVKRDRHLVIATSETARGSYRNPNAADRTADIAAFKESGGIEFKADVAILLRPVEGTDLVDAKIVKNRLRGVGAGDAFRLELNRTRACFSEVAAPSDEDREAESDARTDAMRDRIVEAIRTAAVPIPSLNKLRERCKAIRPHIKARDAAWNALVMELRAEGLILHSRKLGYNLPPTDADRCRTDAAPPARTDAPAPIGSGHRSGHRAEPSGAREPASPGGSEGENAN